MDQSRISLQDSRHEGPLSQVGSQMSGRSSKATDATGVCRQVDHQMPSVSPLQQTSLLRRRFPLQETGWSAAASRKVEAMSLKLKPLVEQVIVVTGASSGI